MKRDETPIDVAHGVLIGALIGLAAWALLLGVLLLILKHWAL